jgi:hypothetical protein
MIPALHNTIEIAGGLSVTPATMPAVRYVGSHNSVYSLLLEDSSQMGSPWFSTFSDARVKEPWEGYNMNES